MFSLAIETGNCELVKMVLENVDQNGQIKDGKILFRYNTQFNLGFQCLFLCLLTWWFGHNSLTSSVGEKHEQIEQNLKFVLKQAFQKNLV